MTRSEAKEFLAGIDPAKVAPPLRFGRNVRWSRAQLEAAIAAAAGLESSNQPDAGSAYENWKASRT
jgi:hypothetical protein